MPDLTFQITGAAPARRGLTPLLHFTLAVTNTPADEAIRSVMLQVQIQIQAAQRRYSREEQQRLFDLFGLPGDWGRTLRSRLWTHVGVNVPAFTGATEVTLPVPCTCDLAVASAKYFYALEEGDVPLQFLFSGSVLYAASDGRLQVQPISWSTECSFRMPVRTWREMMEAHYSDAAFLCVRRDVFDRMHAYRRRHGLPTWEATLEHLLAMADETKVDEAVVGEAIVDEAVVDEAVVDEAVVDEAVVDATPEVVR